MKTKFIFLILGFYAFIFDAQILDPAFGDGGKITYEQFGNPNVMLIQPDNKLLISGKLNNQGFIYRLNEDGTFDSSFGNNGKVIFEYGGYTSHEISVFAVQPDGKILFVHRGSVSSNFQKYERINADGTMDSTFFMPWGGSNSFYFYSSPQLLSDGKIISLFYNAPGTHLVRFDENGQKDTNYGTDGLLFVANERYDYLDAISNDNFILSTNQSKLLNINNNIVIGSLNLESSLYQLKFYNNKYYVNYRGKITCVLPNMTLDQEFGNSGKVIFSTYDTYGDTLIKDQSIYQLNFGKTEKIAEISKFKTTGQFDQSFGVEGRFSFSLNQLSSLKWGKIVSDSENNVIAAISDSSQKMIIAKIKLNELSTYNSDLGKFVFYPNPSTGKINFSDNLHDLQIIDTSSRIVWSKKEKCEFINISFLNEGIYVLTATNDKNEKITFKFIKK